MEKQLEALTALLVRQSEEARKAQEQSQAREERLARMLENVVTQAPSHTTTDDDEGETAARRQSTQSVRFPTSATTIPHLTASASLRESDTWRHKFEGYVTLARVDCLSLAEQRAALAAVLDDEWTRTLRYGISLPRDAELKTILDAMCEYLRSQRNIIMDRRDFYSRVQKPQEGFDDFLCAVKEIANFCEFCDQCMDDQLRDRIVVGTRDEVALKRMLENNKLTLDNAIDICRASESANQCSAVLRGGSHALSHGVNAVSNCKTTETTSNGFGGSRPTGCYRCGKNCRSDKRGCQAIDKVCRSCGKRGHFASVCRQTLKKRRGASRGFSTVSPNRSASPRRGSSARVYQLLSGVYTKAVTARPAPQVVITATHPAGRDKITWTPDSGAETTVIGLDTATLLGIQPSSLMPADGGGLYAAGNHPLTCVGTFSSCLKLGDREAETVVSVVKVVKGALLSWHDSIALGILPEDFPAQIQSLRREERHTNNSSTKHLGASRLPLSTPTEVISWPHTYDPTPQQRAEHAAAVIKAFPNVFGASENLPAMAGGSMAIELADGARPFAVTAPRTIPYNWREEIKSQLDELLNKGVIERVDYPTAWCHPIVPVPKKTSGVRLCVDLTRLNRYVKRPVYPVRSPQDAIASIGTGAVWFTTLDAKM